MSDYPKRGLHDHCVLKTPTSNQPQSKQPNRQEIYAEKNISLNVAVSVFSSTDSLSMHECSSQTWLAPYHVFKTPTSFQQHIKIMDRTETRLTVVGLSREEKSFSAKVDVSLLRSLTRCYVDAWRRIQLSSSFPLPVLLLSSTWVVTREVITWNDR